MTLTNAFQELISANSDWHKLTTMSKEDGILFSDAFTKSGTNAAEVKKVLNAAGYIITETWSKNTKTIIQQTTIAKPKTGIVIDDSYGK
ncbi:hypothetical protein [Pedobacter duraquae]|uniref:Uncharacterized protein n=1 Tax=Pedobacter duraquae TaxID=425511 RepID=A0A4R6IFP6_9SPHI|nr:hypothetical protein [Pedobacter duraquae]TDO20922.1 hypothetical protein CLV32_3558 [Pedobacter duraquae]